MLIFWKGLGWLFLAAVALAALLILPLESLFTRAGWNADLMEAACTSAISAVFTLALAYWLERRDRAADKDLTPAQAQKMHTFYWISLTNWGYLSCLTASGFFVLAVLIAR